MRRRAKQAGGKAPTLHSFRRSFAITMLRNGADLVSLGRMMGHGSLPVLTRYLKQIKEDLGEVHAQHSPADTLL
jgi:site-specific recombinase XerD